MSGFTGFALLKRTRARVACLLIPLVVSSPPAAAAEPEPSLWCIYVVISETREAMRACGDRLDDASEATSVDLRASLKKLMSETIQNTDGLKFLTTPAYDERNRAEYERKSRAGFCQGKDYQDLRAIFRDILTERWVKRTRERIESRTDPREGTCL